MPRNTDDARNACPFQQLVSTCTSACNSRRFLSGWVSDKSLSYQEIFCFKRKIENALSTWPLTERIQWQSQLISVQKLGFSSYHEILSELFFEKYIKFLANYYYFFQKMKHLIYYFESFVRGTNAISWFLGLCWSNNNKNLNTNIRYFSWIIKLLM